VEELATSGTNELLELFLICLAYLPKKLSAFSAASWQVAP